jgi:large subunit ribosomal protein L1
VTHRRRRREGRQGVDRVRAEKAGIVHAGVGKASFSEEAIAANVKALVSAINLAGWRRGTFIKKVSLSSTMVRASSRLHRAQLSAGKEF